MTLVNQKLFFLPQDEGSFNREHPSFTFQPTYNFQRGTRTMPPCASNFIKQKRLDRTEWQPSKQATLAGWLVRLCAAQWGSKHTLDAVARTSLIDISSVALGAKYVRSSVQGQGGATEITGAAREACKIFSSLNCPGCWSPDPYSYHDTSSNPARCLSQKYRRYTLLRVF